MMSEGCTLRFGDFTFDTARQSLSGPAGRITLRRKSADLLLHADRERPAASPAPSLFAIQGGRHLAIVQQPDAFNTVLLQFLAKAGSQPKP
jgi:hypothetical protein